MHVLGIDGSSKSTGLADVVDSELVDSAVWTPPRGRGVTRPAELVDYEDALDAWIADRGFDLAVTEEVVARGHKTIRTLSHFESSTWVVLERRRIPIITIKPGNARHLVLGMEITSKKVEVLAEVRKRWPHLRLPAVNQGGDDVADAFVLALAGPEEMRRR